MIILFVIYGNLFMFILKYFDYIIGFNEWRILMNFDIYEIIIDE